MHILKMVFHNISLFQGDLTIDFTNSDSVRRSPDENDNVLKAFKVKPGIYTQVLMAFTGLNATGKTTILELLSSVSKIIIAGAGLNTQSVRYVLQKLYPRYAETVKGLMSWDIFFAHNRCVYKLHSVINRERNTDRNDFYYEEETLWEKSLASEKHDTLFDFTNEQIKTDRTREAGNPYFKKDMSIVASLGDFSEVLRPVGMDTTANFPAWLGEPTQEALHLFVKYSDYITRNELSKGKIILENAIKGTAPRYKDLQAARQWVEDTVKKVNEA